MIDIRSGTTVALCLIALGGIIGAGSGGSIDFNNVRLGLMVGIALAIVWIVGVVMWNSRSAQRADKKAERARLNEEYKRLLLGPKPQDCTCRMGKPDPKCPWHNR